MVQKGEVEAVSTDLSTGLAVDGQGGSQSSGRDMGLRGEFFKDETGVFLNDVNGKKKKKINIQHREDIIEERPQEAGRVGTNGLGVASH